MHQHPRSTSFLVILIAFVCATLTGDPPDARAGKEVPVVAALCDALEAQLGVRPVYRKVKKAKDGTITIRGLTTEVKKDKATDRKIKATLSVEHIILSGISKDSDGLFDVRNVKLTNLIFISDEDAEAGSALRLPEVSITHLYLKAANGEPSAGGTILPFGVQAQNMVAKNGVFSSGGTSLHVGSIQASWQGDANSGTGQTDLRINDIHYPVSAIRRSDPSGVVLALIGGGDLILDLWGSAVTGVDGGTFEAALSARALGKLKVAGSFAGPSLGVLASAPSASQSDAALPATAVGPIMISRFAIRFEDQSLTGKLVAMLAAEQGVGPEKLIAKAAAAVELGLEDVNNETFIAQLKNAVHSYLTKPKSFTVKSELAQPMPIGLFVESAAEDPSVFLSQVPVSVTAND
jgi:hypothetical protein